MPKKVSSKTTGFFLGLVVFLSLLLFTDLDPGNRSVTSMLAVASLMAIWWITEALPLSVTALVPLVLFPAFGIMDGKNVSVEYMNHIIFIFIGGFIMALAMEKWNLHRRIALKILMYTGIGPGRILFGFMLASAFLSMWISNTATTMMMIPIVVSVVRGLEDNLGKESVSGYATGLVLGIAYSASIGGMSTLVGTPTNLVCPRILGSLFPGSPDISFAQWFFFAFPLAMVIFTAAWLLLFLKFRPRKKWGVVDPYTFRSQYRELGTMGYEEKMVFGLFIFLAFLWIFRADIPVGRITIPGWSSLFPSSGYINDGTVAIFISLVLFILPAHKTGRERLMDWETAVKLPWSIVILFGGGFALAAGFERSGLSAWLGNQFGWASEVHPFLIMIVIITFMSLLTELTSNVASTQMLLPVFASLAVGMGNNPLLLMIPATLASSLAFMLPTATPPNAIIFGTGKVGIPVMVRTGFMLNILGILLVFLLTWLLGVDVFDIEINRLPAWVTP